MPAQWEFQVGPKNFCKTRLWTGHATKSDEFSEKFQREAGGHFIADFGFFRTFSKKKLQYNFPKMREGGSKAVWNFPENSSDLVA